MTTFITLGLIAILCVTIARWITSVPLLRTLSASIDHWADSVQGQDGELMR